MAKARIGRPALARDIALLPSVAVVARAVAEARCALAALAALGACEVSILAPLRARQDTRLAVDAGCTLRTRAAGPEPIGCVVGANALYHVRRFVVHANTMTGAKKAS